MAHCLSKGFENDREVVEVENSQEHEEVAEPELLTSQYSANFLFY